MIFEKNLRCRCASQFHDHALGHERRNHQGFEGSAFYLPEASPKHTPDRLVDVTHIKIECSVDLKTKLLKATCTTDLVAVAPSVERMVFDAIDLQIFEVLDGAGTELKYERTDDKIIVNFRQPLKAGAQTKIVIRYQVQEPRAGLYFIEPTKDYPNRPLQLWTQGQDEDNRYWFPCHDSPNEKATTEMVVTVDDYLTAVSNGALINVTNDSMSKRKTYHWKQSIPHASYLVTLCVGEFVELKDSWKNSQGQEIPVQYYTVSGREKETKFCFGKTPKMMEFFSKKLGVDYPYEKYAQVVAWDFIYGGMENTSATTQTEYTLHPESVEQDYSSEYLVAHELAHQWFGDLVTCNGWHHAWLNEGFATYSESLWTEYEHGIDEALYEIYTQEQLYKEESGSDYSRPIVTNHYLKPSDIFDRHLYEKGGRVLHMLRHQVGDELWWKAVNLYLTTHREKTVETVDLRRAFETVSGQSLGWFFEQWVFKAGHPKLKAAVSWNSERSQVEVAIDQTQKITAEVPLFEFDLKIKICTDSGEEVHTVRVKEKNQKFSFHTDKKPSYCGVNVHNVVLGDWEIAQERDALIAQLTQDTDVMGRITAAKALAKDHSRQSVEALSSALFADKFWGVQVEVAQALGAIGSPLAKEALAKAVASLSHPKARKSALSALAGFGCELTLAVAEKALQEDSSPLVQQAAGVAIGKTRLPVAFDKLSMALGRRESWHDYYDVGILQGLAQLRSDDRVLNILLKYTRVGGSMFLRRTAVSALATYGSPRPSFVIGPLIQFLKDENFFVRLNAIAALETLQEGAALGPLKAVVDSASEPRTRRAALIAMKRIREGRTALDEVEKLKHDLDILRDQYTKVLGRLEKLEKQEPPR